MTDIRIDKLEIKWDYDDMSLPTDYLSSDPKYHASDDVSAEDAAKYAAQDKERIDSFYGDEWGFVGCYAKATVSYPVNGDHARRLESFRSGGLCGIESDSHEDYFREIEAEELGDLKTHLASFGIDISQFDSIEVERED